MTVVLAVLDLHRRRAVERKHAIYDVSRALAFWALVVLRLAPTLKPNVLMIAIKLRRMDK